MRKTVMIFLLLYNLCLCFCSLVFILVLYRCDESVGEGTRIGLRLQSYKQISLEQKEDSFSFLFETLIVTIMFSCLFLCRQTAVKNRTTNQLFG